MRDSKASKAFYAQHEVDVPDAKAGCCSLAGALELITGFWRGKKSTDLAAVTAWLVGALRELETDPGAVVPAAEAPAAVMAPAAAAPAAAAARPTCVCSSCLGFMALP